MFLVSAGVSVAHAFALPMTIRARAISVTACTDGLPGRSQLVNRGGNKGEASRAFRVHRPQVAVEPRRQDEGDTGSVGGVNPSVGTSIDEASPAPWMAALALEYKRGCCSPSPRRWREQVRSILPAGFVKSEPLDRGQLCLLMIGGSRARETDSLLRTERKRPL